MSSSSSSVPANSSFAPLQFVGVSQYSSDFQQVLSRAVSIAQIPVDQLTDQETEITNEETTLGNLNSAVAGVASALQAIGQLGDSGGALSASSTNNQLVTATVTGATPATSYSISNVSSVATPAFERTTKSYADTTSTQVSASGSMQLVYGGQSYPIQLGAGQNNLSGVVSAIKNLNAGVTATILTPSTGVNYLQLSANSPGQTTLQLLDEPTSPTGTATNILNTDINDANGSQGTNTVFDLNGLQVTSPDTSVSNVVSGLTLNFTGTTATSSNATASISVATDPDQIASALQNLVSAYNTLQSQTAQQHGTSGGALTGNSILNQIETAMQSIVQYQAGGAIGNLESLGVGMADDTGQMSFDQTTFNALSTSQLSSALSLLGTSTTGIGGLQQAFTAISDPITGSIAAQTSDWNTMSQNLTDEINDKNAAISNLQQSIDQQLQAADASVANMQSQQSILTASLTSLSYVSYGYNTSTTGSNSI